jgi:two-component sensor histidine kinase
MVASVPDDSNQSWTEAERLAALARYRVLDTPREPEFDDVVRLVGQVCRTPIALITLVDDRRQWFKAKVGLSVDETPLELSFCAKAILQRGLFLVRDTTKDQRFACNPLVTGEPHLRFYAGELLETPEGLPLGTLCVLDHVPRDLDDDQRLCLRTLARQVMSQLELRRAIGERDEALAASRDTQARQSLLVRELHHRVRNTLAMVQALVRATGRSASSMDEFYDGFSARMASLAHTQSLLTEDYWQTARLRDMLTNELQPFRNGHADQIVLEGPPLELAADLAIPIGMVLHELTVNSVKYGALSVPRGQLTVRWDAKHVHGKRKLHLDWRESGGPAVELPKRRGFGSTMLERVLPAQAEADVRINFDAAGLHVQLEAPLVEQRLVPQH